MGQFKSNPKLGIAKHKDFRYIPNIISSAIVNTPPPDLMADLVNKKNKVHQFDQETDEDMIPLFEHGVEGKPRNNKRLMPHRNWCLIREYVPGRTPPHTPEQSVYDLTPQGSPLGSRTVGGVLRRLSKKRQREPTNLSDGHRPPVSMRTMSRGRTSSDSVRLDRHPKVGRAMSLTPRRLQPRKVVPPLQR